MDKLILRKMAKDWAKGILLACDTTSWSEVLEQDENDYLVEEITKIADRITKDDPLRSVDEIFEKYYETK